MSVATLPPRPDRDSEQASREPEQVWPAWLIPPEEGFVAEDLDRLPELPPHTELLNGSLVFVSPQASWHETVLFHLRMAFRAALPREWQVRQNFTVRLGPRDRPEPDIVVARADAIKAETTWVAPEDVRLVVEVESPESRIRDREVKFEKYAAAGIAHYWRVEHDVEEPALPVIHLYELDTEGRYREASVQCGRIEAEIPFAVDIDLTDLS